MLREFSKPLYYRLTDTNLLVRYLEGYRQNNSECLNAKRSLSPKVHYCGAHTVEIASYIAPSIFIDRYTSA